jgi:HSP20 family molecular chaperone IbpA
MSLQGWSRIVDPFQPLKTMSYALSSSPLQDMMQVMDELDEAIWGSPNVCRIPTKCAPSSSSGSKGRSYSSTSTYRSSDGWTLRTEMQELDDAYELVLELPGVRREDVQLAVRGEELVIQAQRALRGAGRSRASSRVEELPAEQVVSGSGEASAGQEKAQAVQGRQGQQAATGAATASAPTATATSSSAVQMQRLERRLSLPQDVQARLVTAELADGLLTIRMPKRAAEQPDEIKILVM